MGKDISRAITYLQENASKIGVILNVGASEELIEKFEKTTQIELPDDIKTLYRFSNGIEVLEDMFNIIPLDNILEDILEDRHNHISGKFSIAEYMIYGDIWEIEINPTDKNSYQITKSDYQSCNEICLTDSMEFFIYRILKGGVFDKGGLCDWYEEKVKLLPPKT
jgi:SMI1 / KNR4 family (SUKH-1)